MHIVYKTSFFTKNLLSSLPSFSQFRVVLYDRGKILGEIVFLGYLEVPTLKSLDPLGEGGAYSATPDPPADLFDHYYVGSGSLRSP